MNTVAVYPGSFDPITNGHLDIIARGLTVFDEVTIAILLNPEKQPLFSPEERESTCRQVLAPLKNVEVKCFAGLTVNFVRECGSAVMLPPSAPPPRPSSASAAWKAARPVSVRV